MDKAERLSQQLAELEREYRDVLTTALQECADGRWGLFGHNEHLHPSAGSSKVDDLRELAASINRLKARLGENLFPLHEDFEAARGRADANDPGEPKQAKTWLERLAES